MKVKSKPSFWISAGLTIASVSWGIANPAIAMDRISTGQIVQVDGDVRLQRADGRMLSPVLGMPIYPGDRFVPESGGGVVLQCADFSLVAVTTSGNRMPCPVEVATLECDPEAVGCSADRNDELESTNAAIPYIISPRRTHLLNDRPSFRWNPVADATEYTVSLEEDGVELWRTKTAETTLNYPADRPSLQPGRSYSLSVKTDTRAYSSEEAPIPGGWSFQLLDAEKAARVREIQAEIEGESLDETGKSLAIAFLYAQNGLISEAIDLLEPLVNGGMETAWIYERLGQLYWEDLQIEQQGNEYYCRAISLADPEDDELEEARDRVSSDCSTANP